MVHFVHHDSTPGFSDNLPFHDSFFVASVVASATQPEADLREGGKLPKGFAACPYTWVIPNCRVVHRPESMTTRRRRGSPLAADYLLLTYAKASLWD